MDRAPMHWLLLSISFLFVLTAATVAYPAAGQKTATPLIGATNGPKSASPDEGGPKASPAGVHEVSDAYFNQCIELWDAGTHMSKKEWQRACRRTSDARAKFEVEDVGRYPSVDSNEALPRPFGADRPKRAPTE